MDKELIIKFRSMGLTTKREIEESYEIFEIFDEEVNYEESNA